MVAWGQRKLALSTLSFLNFYLDLEKSPNPIVVYAGAAPCSNLEFIIKLYPQVTWHLYDPRNFCINTGSKVHIHQEFFTEATARKWEGNDVYFLSDIRTVNVQEYARKFPNNHKEMIERHIWVDMLRQQRWVQIMKPLVAQLKFRLPYSDIPFSDKIDYKTGHAPYLAGIVFKQPWSSITGTETRLLISQDVMVDGEYPIHNWNIKEYEDNMFYHNAVTRESLRYFNPFYPNDPVRRQTPLDENNPTPELNNQWNSIAEIIIFNDYLLKVRFQGDSIKTIKGLNVLLSHNISKDYKMSGRGAKRGPMLTLQFLRANPFYLKKLNLDLTEE